MIFHDLKSFHCQETPKCFHLSDSGFLMEKLEKTSAPTTKVPNSTGGGGNPHQLWLQSRNNPAERTQEQFPILFAHFVGKENFSLG